MRRVTISYACVCVVVIAAGVPLALWTDTLLWVPLIACVVLTVTAIAAIRTLNRYQSHVWRVSISSRHLSVLTVTRCQKTVGWSIIQRVDLSDSGIAIIARRDDQTEACLSVAAEFADFTDLAHRITLEARRWDVPVWVDGMRLEHTNVYALFPTLRQDLAPGTSRGRAPLA